MDESFLSGQTFDKGAEVLHAANDAAINLARFDFAGDDINLLLGSFHGFAVFGVNANLAAVVVVDVDVGSRDLRDATDILAAGTDEGTDFLGIYLHDLDLRGILAQFFTVAGLRGFHYFENFVSRLGHLRDGFLRDGEGQTVNLEVQLKPRDTLAGTAYLEVHVAEMIFSPDDVGEDDVLGDVSVIIAFGNESCGYSRDVFRYWHARIHQGERASAYAGHGGRAVGRHHFRNQSDGIGEFIL